MNRSLHDAADSLIGPLPSSLRSSLSNSPSPLTHDLFHLSWISFILRHASHSNFLFLFLSLSPYPPSYLPLSLPLLSRRSSHFCERAQVQWDPQHSHLHLRHLSSPHFSLRSVWYDRERVREREGRWIERKGMCAYVYKYMCVSVSRWDSAGMNFEYIPELGWHLGYLYFWMLVVGIVIVITSFYIYKGWVWTCVINRGVCLLRERENRFKGNILFS